MTKAGALWAIEEQKEMLRKMLRQVADFSGVEILTYCIISTYSSVCRIRKIYRMLIFGKGSHPWTHKGKLITHEAAIKVLDKQQGRLPKTVLLRCRMRYFTDGAILGSADFVRGFTGAWQKEKGRKYPPKVNSMQGADWGDLTVIQGLRRKVFG